MIPRIHPFTGSMIVRITPLTWLHDSGKSQPERAGPERPERRVETLAPTERLMRGRGTARVRPPLWPARSHAQAGRRAALDAPPERPGRSPLGKRKGLTQ